jgi:hypothetical protein
MCQVYLTRDLKHPYRISTVHGQCSYPIKQTRTKSLSSYGINNVNRPLYEQNDQFYHRIVPTKGYNIVKINV